jgi:hypothetical protein
MNLENVQRISAASESACIAVLQKPEDAGARKRLFVANRRHPTPLVDSTQGGRKPPPIAQPFGVSTESMANAIANLTGSNRSSER